MQRHNISSSSPWEDVFGYSRAVRVGPHVHVSGTTAFGADGELVGAGDVAAQTAQCLRNIGAALEAAGATLADVVRTRVYVTDAERWRDVAAVHSEFFGAVRPAATLVEIARLIEPELLVEIEADAFAPLAGAPALE